MLLAVMRFVELISGNLTCTEFFGEAAVPATAATPLRLNTALPSTFSAVPSRLEALTPVPVVLSPPTPMTAPEP